MRNSNHDVQFASVLNLTFIIVTVSVGLVLFSGCADDPLFNPNPPIYTWNPGKPFADSVSYMDDDSITLYGHFQPKAYVVTVKTFCFELSEVEGETIKKTDTYLIQKDVVWEFTATNLYDTLIIANRTIPRIKPKPNTTYRFRMIITVVTPPGSSSPTLDRVSNSLNVLANASN
jgi:hypothetical protein